MSGADEGQQAAGNAWGDDIPPERQAELEVLFLRQAEWAAKSATERGASAFKDMPLKGADVFWLAARTIAGTDEAQAVTEQMGKLRQAQGDIQTPLQLLLLTLSVSGAGLQGANLSGAVLGFADLSGATMGGANLSGALLFRTNLSGAALDEANLSEVFLGRADLSGASLYRANLSRAHLGEANLSGANLDEANLSGAWLDGARLTVETTVRETTLSTTTTLTDVVWNNAPIARVAWESLPMLGDETQARKRRTKGGTKKDTPMRIKEYEAAVRAYRLLSVALRSQGLNEHADRYAYRAQLMQRVVLRLQRRWGRALGSWLLDLVSGYGYEPMRSVIAYIFIICLFAAAYLLNAQFAAPHLTWDEAMVLSVSSFHGRGFFNSGINLGDTLARLAAGEAIIGLLLEITFIATFTQRFFAR